MSRLLELQRYGQSLWLDSKMVEVTARLLDEGLRLFVEPCDTLLASVDKARTAALVPSAPPATR